MDGQTRRRIILVTETRYPQINGVSRVVDHLVRRLLDRGWSIQLMSPRYGRDEFYRQEHIRKDTYPSIRFPLYRDIRLPMVTPAAVGRRISRFRPDAIHIFTEGPLGLAALKHAKSAGLPVVTSYHTNFPTYMKHYRMPWLEPHTWKYLKWFHNSAAATLAPTREMADLLAARGFRDVTAWGHGVDTELFHPDRKSLVHRDSMGASPGDTIFLYVGRVAPEKNIHTLIEAFRKMPVKEGIRLVVVGEGPFLRKIASLHDHRIELLGFQDAASLSQIYASADVFVFPSLTDTFGLVVLEAMASGLPVAAFDVTGPRTSISDGHNGLLADSRTAEGLAEVMMRMHRDKFLRKKLAGFARDHAVANGWDRIMDRSISIYEHLSGNACIPSGASGTDRHQTVEKRITKRA